MNVYDARMQDGAVRQLAQSDPAQNLAQQYGTFCTQAKRQLEDFIRTLAALDNLAAKMSEHGIEVSVDLGPVGNQAAAARRDLERDTGRTFELPRNDRG